MTITLTSKEFDEAVSLWLEDQGFSPDSYNISTRVIAGRSDGPLGTSLEVNLDAKPRNTTHYEVIAGVAGMLDNLSPIVPSSSDTRNTSSFSQRASQGHADE